MDRERIYVVCAASDNLVGRLIRKLTRSSVNHTFLLYESRMWGGWWAAQIGPDGVKKLPAGPVMQKYYLTECYEYAGNLGPGLTACRAMVGQRYDYWGVLGYLLRLVAKRVVDRDIRNPWNVQNEEFCSEFVAHVLKAARVDHFRDCDPASLSPGEVRGYLCVNPNFQWRAWP